MADETQAPAITAQDLLREFKQDDGTFDVRLRSDVTLTLRRPQNADEYLELGQLATKFARMVMGERCPPDFKAFRPRVGDVAIMAYWLHRLCVAPRFSQREALQLGAECGPTLNYVYATIQEKIARQVAVAETEALDDLGEGSEETCSGATT